MIKFYFRFFALFLVSRKIEEVISEQRGLYVASKQNKDFLFFTLNFASRQLVSN